MSRHCFLQGNFKHISLNPTDSKSLMKYYMLVTGPFTEQECEYVHCSGTQIKFSISLKRLESHKCD